PVNESKCRRDRLATRVKGNCIVLSADQDKKLTKNFQEQNLYCLTGIDQPDAIFLLDAASDPPNEFLFLPERKPAEERWTGIKMGPGAEAEKATGFAKVLATSDFEHELKKVSERAKAVFDLKDVEKDIAYLRQVKS